MDYRGYSSRLETNNPNKGYAQEQVWISDHVKLETLYICLSNPLTY